MATLPENVRQAWEDRDGPVILATVDETGVPNIIYATCVNAFGDDRLVVADNRFSKTRRNLLGGGIGSLLFRCKSGEAYQVKGGLEYHTEGEVFDAMKSWNLPGYPGRGAAVLTVEEVYSGAERIETVETAASPQSRWEIARDHAANPRNCGPLESPDGHARITGPCGDTMEFWFIAKDGRMERVSFVTDGCGASRACGSMTTTLAEGLLIEDAAALQKSDVLDAFDGFPPASEHCALLATSVLAAACEEYLDRQSTIMAPAEPPGGTA